MAPARKQITRAQLDEYLRERKPEGGTYNIWHNRWKGLERDWSKKNQRAKFRCNVERDSGETVGSNNPNAYFCVYFAKGMCIQGSECSMWHRIPNEKDEVETTIDCFGRDKFMEFRQDMGGVGSFNTQNKTLYVGRVSGTADMGHVVRKHFEAFGEIERLRYIRHRGVAFVTYKGRSNAEFAREAMMNQTLDNNETINVRWATAEQNKPGAEGEETLIARQIEAAEAPGKKRALEASYVRQEVESELPAEFTQTKREVNEDGFRQMENEAKRQRAEQEDRRQIDYDEEAARALYGYTSEDQAWQAAMVAQQQRQQQLRQQQQQRAGGIIPESVLSGLKTIAQPTASQTTATKSTNGLGSLANYASDSEDE
ncbi:hypothetical protein BCR43DRAFT_494508 [Syncephalastrum racemosum]|uniref:Pre-mRNA-splicing factor cwc2 n=1 Tax=Syncephalastrum racemosum TaxID=13706 RepID=A0A1X2H866_SYNRA|nr:hypothetical protein BCR43DRAFT_494508 [Syncephalastrum racemosum]